MRDLRENALPITAIVAVVAFAIAATWTGAQWKSALDANTEAIKKLAAQFDDTWTRVDHDNWAAMLFKLNPSLVLPPAERRRSTR